MAHEVLLAIGCAPPSAAIIAEHLVEADLRGVSSHGTMRLTQYAKQAQTGYLNPAGTPTATQTARGSTVVDGGGGYGHPAMMMGVREAIERARGSTSSVVAVRNCGHTGRLGHYAEVAAGSDIATIIAGGGRRDLWRQVAPHGGIDPKLATNPWAFGFPGTDAGPIVVDFATAAAAGGRVMAAKKRGERLGSPDLLTADGEPTDNPDAYLTDGGSIRPFAGPKGFGMGLIAELFASAMLGDDTPESNWIIVAIDVSAFQNSESRLHLVQALIDDVTSSRPAPGFDRVEIPGQRSHARMLERRRAGIPMHEGVWRELQELHTRLTAE